jgi:hypothetical protein
LCVSGKHQNYVVKEPAELDCPTHSALLEVEEEEEEGAAVAAVEPSRTAKFYFAPDPFLMCLQTSKVAAADESESKKNCHFQMPKLRLGEVFQKSQFRDFGCADL